VKALLHLKHGFLEHRDHVCIVVPVQRASMFSCSLFCILIFLNVRLASARYHIVILRCNDVYTIFLCFCKTRSASTTRRPAGANLESANACQDPTTSEINRAQRNFDFFSDDQQLIRQPLSPPTTVHPHTQLPTWVAFELRPSRSPPRSSLSVTTPSCRSTSRPTRGSAMRCAHSRK
jgi:hypothetical protein